MKKVFSFLTGCGLALQVPAQNIGDHYAAGFNPNRTYLNSDLGDFGPVLELTETLSLGQIGSADSVIAFSDSEQRFLLIGEGGTAPSYHLYSRETDSLSWSFVLSWRNATTGLYPGLLSECRPVGRSGYHHSEIRPRFHWGAALGRHQCGRDGRPLSPSFRKTWPCTTDATKWWPRTP